MKKYKPITSSMRHRRIVLRSNLRDSGFKPLKLGLSKTGFRNNSGRITLRHRGGGHKRTYRLIDTQRIRAKNTAIQVVRLEYDPNRTAFIALCKTINQIPQDVKNILKPVTNSVYLSNRKYFYILAPHNLEVGQILKPEDQVIGTALPLKDFQEGTMLYNLELHPGKGGQLARAAGTYCTLLKKLPEHNKVLIRLPSKQNILLPDTNLGTKGRVSNILHSQTSLGKAGASRWLGRRPIVRGEATNPIDHPHGGKTRGGRPIKNIWGKLAKWVPTSKNKKNQINKINLLLK